MKIWLRSSILVLLLGGALFAARELWITTAPSELWTKLEEGKIIVPGEIILPGEIRRHPDAEYLVRPEGVLFHDLAAETSVLSKLLQRHLDRLLTATEVGSIGVFDGPEAFIFGEVGDVDLSGDPVYVLDVQAEEVRVFSTTGAHLASFGEPRQGPGEFVTPRTLAIEPDTKQVWVGDVT